MLRVGDTLRWSVYYLTGVFRSVALDCYQIVPDESSKFMSGYVWSRENSLEASYKLPYRAEEWIPDRDIRFEGGVRMSAATLVNGGRLSNESRMRLMRVWTIVHAGSNAPYDVIGQFKARSVQFPLLSEKLMHAVSNLDERMFEYVRLENCWHAQTDSKFEGGPYYFANLLPRQNTWVREQMEFMSISSADGTKLEFVKHSKRVVCRAAVGEYPAWRDSATGEVVCTEEFRDCLLATGCRGWRFRQVEVS